MKPTILQIVCGAKASTDGSWVVVGGSRRWSPGGCMGDDAEAGAAVAVAPPAPRILKLLTIGDWAVGKTSLLTTFYTGAWPVI